MKKLLILSLPLFLFSCTKKEYIDVHVYNEIPDTSKWIYPELNTGWSTNLSGGSVKYKVKDSIVYVTGISTCSNNAVKTMFNIPVGFRPKYQVYSSVDITNGEEVPVSVYSGGDISFKTVPYGNAVYFNISYPIN